VHSITNSFIFKNLPFYVNSLTLDSILRRKITVVVLAALAFLASWAIHRFLKSYRSKKRPANLLTIESERRPANLLPIEKVEEPGRELNDIVVKKLDSPNEERLNPHWINDHPTTSLWDLGLNNFEKLIDFVRKYGPQLTSLHLKLLDINDKEFEELVCYTSNIHCLSISSLNMTDSALKHLKRMPLTSVNFSCCDNLTDGALSHLQGMPLTSINFSYCYNLTDGALSHLQGMPLTSVNFSYCYKLTDDALSHLQGMPLTSINFSYCDNLTNDALSHLQGMPLTSINFSCCDNLTNDALSHLQGMPLTSINFSCCDNLTNDALSHLQRMPLTSVNFSCCHKLTDDVLSHLQGMPLKSVDFSFCKELTDNALRHLKGIPLTSVNFSYCNKLTDRALLSPPNLLPIEKVEEPGRELNHIVVKKLDSPNEERLNPHSINNHPKTSLWDLGLDNFLRYRYGI